MKEVRNSVEAYFGKGKDSRMERLNHILVQRMESLGYAGRESQECF